MIFFHFLLSIVCILLVDTNEFEHLQQSNFSSINDSRTNLEFSSIFNNASELTSALVETTTPSQSPSQLSEAPSFNPSFAPSKTPSKTPSQKPSVQPSIFIPEPNPHTDSTYDVDSAFVFKKVFYYFHGSDLIINLTGSLQLNGTLAVSLAQVSNSLTIYGNNQAISPLHEEGSLEFSDDRNKFVYINDVQFVSLVRAVVLQEASAVITRCQFFDNDHGFMYSRPDSDFFTPSITIQDSNFTENAVTLQADVEAAGVYILQVHDVTIQGCIFLKNNGRDSERFRGAVNVQLFRNFEMTSCDFSKNDYGGLQLIGFGEDLSVYIHGITFQHGDFAPALSILGRAIHETFDGIAVIKESSFLHNQATNFHAAALYTENFAGVLNVTNSSFIANSGNKQGAVGFEGPGRDSANITFESCVFDGNIADSGGGGICNEANIYSLVIRNSNFTRNICNGYMGGGVYIANTANLVEISGTLFHGHYSDKHGAALAIFTIVNFVWIHSHTIFSGNIAKGEGGAIYYSQVDDREYMTVEFSTFENNVAPDGGPTLWIDNSFLRNVNHTEFVCIYFDIGENNDHGIANIINNHNYKPPIHGCPTVAPTFNPSRSPTVAPTLHPATSQPSQSPSHSPTTSTPSHSPTVSPTLAPVPTVHPTVNPSVAPSWNPSVDPTLAPTITDPSTLNETTFTYSTLLISGACFSIFCLMICCIVQNFPWEGKDDGYVGSELMSPFLPNSPEEKVKKITSYEIRPLNSGDEGEQMLGSHKSTPEDDRIFASLDGTTLGSSP